MSDDGGNFVFTMACLIGRVTNCNGFGLIVTFVFFDRIFVETTTCLCLIWRGRSVAGFARSLKGAALYV